MHALVACWENWSKDGWAFTMGKDSFAGGNMFLISDGTLNSVTDAIVVERECDVKLAVEELQRLLVSRGFDPSTVTVNPVGPPCGQVIPK